MLIQQEGIKVILMMSHKNKFNIIKLMKRLMIIIKIKKEERKKKTNLY